MCTAITYRTGDFYLGRTLDYDHDFGEEVVLTPRCFPLRFRAGAQVRRHYAIIGMARVEDGYPLYFDGANEKGLAMAGLNFVGNACYRPAALGKRNVAQFELIPWVLSQCADVRQARDLLTGANITGEAFRPDLPPAQLHWIIADRESAITVEAVAEGLRIHDNTVGVLTNNPPFETQLLRLCEYMNLSPKEPENRFSAGVRLRPVSRGMGAMGLPGDLSSTSRFARAAFVKMNSVSGSAEAESVSQFFHILDSVDQQRGCCEVGDGEYEITIYTSCCNCDKGIYYYTTYDNRQINGVDMHRENLNGSELVRHPLIQNQPIPMQN